MNSCIDKCFYCRKDLPNGAIDYTLDHIVPLILRGNNKPINKVRACYDCNQWKGTKSIESIYNEYKDDPLSCPVPFENIEFLHNYVTMMGSRLLMTATQRRNYDKRHAAGKKTASKLRRGTRTAFDEPLKKPIKKIKLKPKPTETNFTVDKSNGMVIIDVP